MIDKEKGRSLKDFAEIELHFKELLKDSPEINAQDLKADVTIPGCKLLGIKSSVGTFIIGHKNPAFILDKDRQVFIYYNYKDLKWRFTSRVTDSFEVDEYKAWQILFPDLLEGHPGKGYYHVKPSSAKPITVMVKVGEPHDKYIKVKVIDISCFDISFVAVLEKYFKVGEILPLMEFSVPDGRFTIKVKGQISSVENNVVGVMFKGLTERQEDIIAKYQASRNSEISGGVDEGLDAKDMVRKQLEPANTIARILLVEDQPLPQIVIGDALKKNNFLVIIANNGIEGISKAKEESPDLILMDMNMPKMNGDEACKRIKADPDTKDIPILMLTTAQDKETIVRAIQSGANDYIIKSGEHATVIKKVRNALIKKGVLKE